MSPAIQGDYISDLDPLASITQLPGGLFEVEVLAGPVAGAYVTRRLTTEQLTEYLGLSTDTTELQINSQQGKRTAVVKLVQPLSLLSVVALAANNVQAYALQVNTYTTSWQAGYARASLPTAQADLDALTTSQYAAGAELEITTAAVDDTAEAILILSFRA